MPSFSCANSMISRFLASWAIWISDFGLVCCEAGIDVSPIFQNHHLTLRSARRARLEGWATLSLLPILRDASLRDAPQDEVVVRADSPGHASAEPCAHRKLGSRCEFAGTDLGAIRWLHAQHL